MNRVIRKKKISEYIIDEVKKMLENDTLREGDKLPNQLAFSKQLGVGRSSLREAIQKLEMMGVVKQNPKLGTIIINGDPRRWVDTEPLYIETKTTFELLEARRIIETAAAEVLINHISEEEIDKLETIVKRMEEADQSSDVEAMSHYGFDFHILLAKSTKNRYLVNMYLSIYNQLGEFIEQAFQYNPNIKKQIVKWHKELVYELRKDDKSGFPEMLRKHLVSTEEVFQKNNQKNRKV